MPQASSAVAAGWPYCSLQPSPCRISVMPLFYLEPEIPFPDFPRQGCICFFLSLPSPQNGPGTFFFFLSVCLAALGLSCSTQDPRTSLWHVVSLAEACKHLAVACGIEFPDQGSNPGPLPWEHGILATGLPGKSLGLEHYLKAPAWHCSLPARELVSL